MKLKRAGMATKLLVLVLLAAAAIALLSTQAQLNAAQADRDALKRQVQEQREANAALQDSIDHSDDPEYLADIARSRLGLVEPGEIEFVDSSNRSAQRDRLTKSIHTEREKRDLWGLKLVLSWMER